MSPLSELQVKETPDQLNLIFSGQLDAHGTARLWDTACTAVSRAKIPAMALDLEGVTYLDLAGAAFMAQLKTQAKDKNLPVRVSGLKPEFSTLLDLAENTKGQAAASPVQLSFVEETGEKLSHTLADIRTFITFTGEITWALAAMIRHPRSIRWQETMMVAERSGVDALPIVALISFIVGLVMAFQAAIPMKMFGAEIYVANLIGIAMVRELGPLMTAIVLAGRSASAFAAEIGTMKINEEIDALTVMGMEPVKFLIIPRVIAATLITPLLTVFANLVGILGGALVVTSFGYPFITYYNQVVNFVSWQDLTGGLVKCFVFGLLIAATGCIRGYQTLRGPSAVGDSTTSAVVTSIILIAVFDGIFSVIYYYLGV